MKKIRWDYIGIGAGITILTVAVVVVLWSGGPASIFTAIAMILVFGGMGRILYKILWQPKFNTKRLQKTGIPATAKILKIEETNIAINNNPQIKLIMAVTGQGGGVYTTSCKTIVPKFKPMPYKAGSQINIKIDPADEKNVILDEG